MAFYVLKDSDGYWGRRPKHLSVMGELLAEFEITPGTVFVLGDEDDESAPAAAIVRMAPNSVLAKHGHMCERFEIVLEGWMTNEDGVVLRPGDVMVARTGEAYGPHTAGPEGCRTLEMFSTLEGLHKSLLEVDGEMVAVDFNSREETRALLERWKEAGVI